MITEIVAPALSTRGKESSEIVATRASITVNTNEREAADKGGSSASGPVDAGSETTTNNRRNELLGNLVGADTAVYKAYSTSELSLLFNQDRLIAADHEHEEANAEAAATAGDSQSPPHSPSVGAPSITMSNEESMGLFDDVHFQDQMGPDMWRDPTKVGPDSD